MVDIEVTDNPIERPVFRPIWLLFERKTDLNALKRWLAKYSKWFGSADLNDSYYPELPAFGRKTLSFIKIPSGLMYDPCSMDLTAPEGSVDRWTWIIQNCKKPVYVLPHGVGLAFTSEVEAMHFKLKWT